MHGPTRARLHLTVSGARFFLFHPEDCADEAGELDPPEGALARGEVVGLRLGADGPRGLELTTELSADDRADVDGAPFVFPLRVHHGRLFATDRVAGVDEYEWDEEPCARLSPGTYRASWYRLSASACRRRAVNWLLHVEPVDSLEGLDAWPALPHEDDRPGPAPAPAPPRPRARARHAKFGAGVVAREGPDKLTIDFEDGQRRTLLRRFVTLVDDDR